MNIVQLLGFVFLQFLASKFYIFCLSVLVFLAMFVSNKRQNGWTDRAQILCGTSHDPREGLWRIKISKLASNKIRFSLNLKNPRNFFIKSANFFSLFYNVYNYKLFTIKIENGLEASWKPSLIHFIQHPASSWVELIHRHTRI